MRPHRAATMAIALLSCAVLLFELVLLRIFSFAIWHHFASMVLSIALLGFGVGGIALQLRPSLGAPAAARAGRYALLFGVAAALAVALVARVPFDPTKLASEPVQALYLALYYAVLAVPFAFGGLGVVVLLGGDPERSSSLYGADLAGAAVGCLAVGPVLGVLGAGGVVLFAGALAALACALLGSSGGARGRTAAVGVLAAAAFALAIPWSDALLAFEPGASKALRAFTDRSAFPDARLVHSEWNELARVDVVERTGGVSWLRNPGAGLPERAWTQIVLDGDAATPVADFGAHPEALPLLDATLSSAALQAFAPERVLVIGAGGGVDVRTALHHGASHVDAVELNPVVARLVTGRYADATGGLFARPDVRLHVGEGRAFVRSTRDRWDLIQLSLIDTWAASASGAYSLSEGYLYTTEAFEDYLDRLTDDGVLAITRWLWRPPRETLKLTTVAAAALRTRGVADPSQHVVVLGLGRLGSVLVKRTPFREDEIAALERVMAARGFGGLHAPARPSTSEFARFLRARDPDAFFTSYPFDVRPATDDSPFFFNFGRWPAPSEWVAGFRESMLALSGRLVLLAVLAQATLLSLVLLVLPVLARRAPRASPDASGRKRAGPTVLYFALVGLGFMLLEVVLMQRFALFLGHPLYAVGFVMAVLLGAAGVGSLLSKRVGPRARWAFVAVVGLTALYAIALPSVFRATLGLPIEARLGIGALLLVPLGLALGIPFPAGLARLVHERAPDALGWAWAANGCASVVGPVLAALLALDAGFGAVMALAAGCYAAAGLVFERARAQSASDASP